MAMTMTCRSSAGFRSGDRRGPVRAATWQSICRQHSGHGERRGEARRRGRAGMCLLVRSTEPTSSCHGRVRVQLRLRVRVLEKNQMDRRAILFPLPLPPSRPSLAPCSGRCPMSVYYGGGRVWGMRYSDTPHVCVCACVLNTANLRSVHGRSCAAHENDKSFWQWFDG